MSARTNTVATPASRTSTSVRGGLPASAFPGTLRRATTGRSWALTFTPYSLPPAAGAEGACAPPRAAQRIRAAGTGEDEGGHEDGGQHRAKTPHTYISAASARPQRGWAAACSPERV